MAQCDLGKTLYLKYLREAADIAARIESPSKRQSPRLTKKCKLMGGDETDLEQDLGSDDDAPHMDVVAKDRGMEESLA